MVDSPVRSGPHPQCTQTPHPCPRPHAPRPLLPQELIATNKTKNLSEQHLIDCANSAYGFQSRGCAGGWPTDGFQYVFRNNQTTDFRYPFV